MALSLGEVHGWWRAYPQVLPASVLVSTGFVGGVMGFELTAQAVQPFPIGTKRDAAA